MTDKPKTRVRRVPKLLDGRGGKVAKVWQAITTNGDKYGIAVAENQGEAISNSQASYSRQE